MKFTYFVLVLLACGVIGNRPKAIGQSAAESPTWVDSHVVPRDIPTTGVPNAHVFLCGEPVSIRIPKEVAGVRRWQVTDETERSVAGGALDDERAQSILIGDLPVGWYRIALIDNTGTEIGWTTAAVLAPLVAATPQDSPICVDSATAWFAKNDPDKQQQFARLAALAGVNWVRDRMSWREIQPAADQWATDTTYDSSATIQHQQGLKVLQVHHDTPRWAIEKDGTTGRFPHDLRHVYQFARAMATRYQGRVQAWEPWNEANVATFGGHTMAEICSFQKAAYLGFKSADPDVTVGWSVTTATPTDGQTDTIVRNETWSYFDTFNFHTYDWADQYVRLWEPVRRAACGKPLWITESDRGTKVDAALPQHELSMNSARLKAQYVTQSFAQSMQAGTHRHFHFILGHYGEGETQFGLLRHDMTPRPGYVALAVAGRYLAGAHSLGRFEVPDQPDVYLYAFRAAPDGNPHDVIVAWTEKTADWSARGAAQYDWRLPPEIQVQRSVDYLGREVTVGESLRLSSSPMYVLVPEGTCDALALTSPALSERREEKPVPIVLQCVMPRGTAKNVSKVPWAAEFEYVVEPGKTYQVPFYVYNFGNDTLRGNVQLHRTHDTCKASPTDWPVEIEPQERVELVADMTFAGTDAANLDEDHWITLRGDFGEAVHSVLALRVVVDGKREGEK